MSTNSCGLTGVNSNGNGSLMRIHPFVLYAYYNGIKDEKEFVDMIAKASALTHAHKCSIDGCIIYAYVLRELLNNPDKSSVYKGIDCAKFVRPFGRYYDRVFSGEIGKIRRDDIKSTGYVVDSLEAAIWCLLTTNNYAECVLKAVNLGGDTDTIAAIAGGLAGALYGVDAIEQDWLDTLKKKDYIENMCKNAYERWRINDMEDI
jgi:ADP-ribosylglycohydrolase